MDSQFCELRWLFRIFLVTKANTYIYRLLSFGHTLKHNRYYWYGKIDTDHVVINGYNLAVEKSSTVFKVRSSRN